MTRPTIKPGEYRSRFPHANQVRVMAVCEGWVMLRHKGGVPFLLRESEFHIEYMPLGRSRSDIRCNIPYAHNTPAAGELPCENCGWPICEHPLRAPKAATP